MGMMLHRNGLLEQALGGNDADFNNVAFLAGWENGFIDESQYDHSISVLSTTNRDNTKKKFGDWSVLTASSSARMEIAQTGEFDTGADPWTIECWHWPTVLNSWNMMMGCWTSGGSGPRQYALYRRSGILQGSLCVDGTNPINPAALTPALPAGGEWLAQWYHVVMDYDGSAFRCYIYDPVVDAVSIEADPTPRTLHNGQSNFSIGNHTGGGGNYANGYYDEVRATIGVARYAGNYVPQTVPFPRS